MKYSSTILINELLMHVTIWMNLQSLKLSESQAQKTAYSMILFILYFHCRIGTTIGRGECLPGASSRRKSLIERSTGKLSEVLEIFYILYYGCSGDYMAVGICLSLLKHLLKKSGF